MNRAGFCSDRAFHGIGLTAVAAVLMVATAGCQHRGEQSPRGALLVGIPAEAVMVREVSNRAVYRVQQPGRLYLYNVTRGRMVEQYPVRAGQQLAVDTNRGRAMLDGQAVLWGKLKAGDTYRIYLLPD